MTRWANTRLWAALTMLLTACPADDPGTEGADSATPDAVTTDVDDPGQDALADSSATADTEAATAPPDAIATDTTAGDGADTSTPPGEPLLLLGQHADGDVDAVSHPRFTLDLRAGDAVRLSAFTLRGDLQPSAYVTRAGVAVSPAHVDLGDRQVVVDFAITETARYVLELRPYQDQGAGRALLRAECAGGPCATDPVPVPDVPLRVIAINDLHGQIEARTDGSGGAAWLAAHVAALRADAPHAIFVAAGDLVGASPYISARFHDEPTMEAMNLAGLDLNAVGNHEFDEGPAELLRLAHGGCHPTDGCQDGTPYDGAAFDVLAANVRDADGAPLFPPYAVRVFGGLPVAFIGMTLEGTPNTTIASAVEGLSFDDEVQTVNALLPRLRELGVEAIVILLHEGGSQSGGGGANECNAFSGAVKYIAAGLDDAVDVLVTGHTHQVYNCMIGGKLVTSAGTGGRWLTAIDLTLYADTRDAWVVAAENRLVDHSVTPDAAVAALVARYAALIQAEVAAVVGRVAGALNRQTDDSGESTLGNVIADSQWFATRDSAGAEMAFTNSSGIRADLPAGDVTFGQVFATQPFQNPLVTMTLTGAQLLALLNDQFAFGGTPILQLSGSLSYHITAGANGKFHVVPGSVAVGGVPLDVAAPYRITVSSFLAENEPAFQAGTDMVYGILDSEALAAYLTASSPLQVPARDRVTID